jgi:hypothetical protein
MIQFRRFIFLSSLVGIAASLIGACDQPESPEKIDFQPGQFVSAKRCGSCHKDIYAAWNMSLHAASAEDSIFKASYEEALQTVGEQAKTLCLACHAPTVVVTKDYDMTREITREGVTCDFCHSLKGTELVAHKEPFVLDVGEVKYGPIRDAESTAHQVAFSEFHTTSLHCAGCHEYENAHGVPLLSTYSEWERYRQGGGEKSCQECHMPQALANVVDPKVKRVEGGFVNLHIMPGGHSRDQLVKSLRMRILEVKKTANGLVVRVSLANTKAGHMVPTGSPTRKVLLNIDVTTDSGKVFHADHVYQRVVLDSQGREIVKDSQVFTEARKVVQDSRIAPGEQRLEEFLLPVPADENITIKATLTYLYSPHNRKETETRIDFASEQKELLSRWAR